MIKVEHIQASICAITGQRIDTLLCEYPRVVHSQLLTHRVFSKNSSSTRAIPLQKAIDQINDNPAEYVWTENQAGMQGELITEPSTLNQIDIVYKNAMHSAIEEARNLAELGAHKQNAGRLLEPFQNIKIVLTSTEWENWDWLRDDPAAQGEIAELARAISKARKDAEPMVIKAGEWHVPFVERGRVVKTGQQNEHQLGNMVYTLKDSLLDLTPEEAKLISMSVCAQTSYRNADYSLEKAIDMRGKLLDTKKVHASPSEHQATPIPKFEWNATCEWPEGVTHMDRNYEYWSGNFRGFIQHRQLLKGHDRAKK